MKKKIDFNIDSNQYRENTGLLMPKGLKEKLKKIAELNNRSLSAQILHYLQHSIQDKDQIDSP